MGLARYADRLPGARAGLSPCNSVEQRWPGGRARPPESPDALQIGGGPLGRLRMRSRGLAGARAWPGMLAGVELLGGGRKIIQAQRCCSDLQSQVRLGKNFLSLR